VKVSGAAFFAGAVLLLLGLFSVCAIFKRLSA
jgi:hypothetical protein